MGSTAAAEPLTAPDRATGWPGRPALGWGLVDSVDRHLLGEGRGVAVFPARGMESAPLGQVLKGSREGGDGVGVVHG